ELSEEKAPGQLRVMFLGTSQTWGEGALVIEDRFVERIARALDGRASIAPVEVVNLGVCGAVSRQLLHYYRESWIEYAPDLVVLNLSVNDGEQDDFAANLRAFVELNRERGIETLFSLEATDIENSS